jgi:hypothetical protein
VRDDRIDVAISQICDQVTLCGRWSNQQRDGQNSVPGNQICEVMAGSTWPVA